MDDKGNGYAFQLRVAQVDAFLLGQVEKLLGGLAVASRFQRLLRDAVNVHALSSSSSYFTKQFGLPLFRLTTSRRTAYLGTPWCTFGFGNDTWALHYSIAPVRWAVNAFVGAS